MLTHLTKTVSLLRERTLINHSPIIQFPLLIMETTHFLASSTRWCISEGQYKIYHNLWLSLFNENKNKYFRSSTVTGNFWTLGLIWLMDSFILNITTQSIFCCKILAKTKTFIKCSKIQVQIENKSVTSSDKATSHVLLPTMTCFDQHNMERLSAVIHLKTAFKHSFISSQISM